MYNWFYYIFNRLYARQSCQKVEKKESQQPFHRRQASQAQTQRAQGGS